MAILAAFVGSRPAKLVIEKRQRCCVFVLWFQSTLVTTWFCFVKVGAGETDVADGNSLPPTSNVSICAQRRSSLSRDRHKGIEDCQDSLAIDQESS